MLSEMVIRADIVVAVAALVAGFALVLGFALGSAGRQVKIIKIYKPYTSPKLVTAYKSLYAEMSRLKLQLAEMKEDTLPVKVALVK